MTENSNSKGKQNLEKEIEELKSQISQLDLVVREKLKELSNFELKAGEFDSDEEYQERCSELEREVEELQAKKTKLRSRKEYLENVLKIQEAVKEGMSKVLLYLPMIKSLLAENKGVLVDISGTFLDSVCDLVDGLDKPLDKLFKLSANQLFKRFNSLKEAGFNDHQALALLIASNAQAVDTLNRFASLVDKIPSKPSQIGQIK